MSRVQLVATIVATVTIVSSGAFATLSFAGLGARTGIAGSFHDMNYYAPTKGGRAEKFERVCVFCHTPHNADVNAPDSLPTPGGNANYAPLWNHDRSQLTFTPYQWATPANQEFTINDPLVGPTRLCMSCHDGSIAVDQHGSAMPQIGTIKISGKRSIGSGLTTTHPIGFDYVNARTLRNRTAINGIALPTQVSEIIPETNAFATDIVINTDSNSNTYNSVTRAGTRTIASALYNGKIMTCATCHEVHNKENAIQAVATDGSPTPNYFLYAKLQNSLICLSCHVK
jgi:cytochrome c553